MKIEKSASWRTKIKKDEIVEMFKKLFSSRKKTAVVTILVLLAVIIAWRVLGSRKGQPEFQTARVEKGTIVSTISASGNLIQTDSFVVTTQATGVIKSVLVEEGDIVEAGQKILEITLDGTGQQRNASAWSSYLSAKNNLESAKVTQYSLQSDMFSKWKAFKDLAESSSYDTPEERSLPQFHIAENDWLAAEAKYKNQQNVISQSQVALNNAWLSYQLSSPTVLAPQSGKVFDISVAPGMTLSSDTSDQTTGQKIITIVSEQQPLVTVSVNEIDIGKIAIEQKATLTFDAVIDKTFTGEVVGIDRTGTQTSGVVNYPLLIQLDTAYEYLYPNMTATAEIIIEAKGDVLWVPPQAIRRQVEQTFVRVLVNGKPQEKQVEVGLETSSQAEIISGLSEGETIVVSEVTAGEEATFGGGGGMRGIMPGGGFGGR